MSAIKMNAAYNDGALILKEQAREVEDNYTRGHLRSGFRARPFFAD